MQHVNRRIESLEPGTPLVLGRVERHYVERRMRAEAEIVTLASVADGFATVVDAAGRERRIHARSRGEFHEGDAIEPNYGDPRIRWRNDAVGARRASVIWSDALPSGSPAQILAFAEAVLGRSEDYRMKAILLHVEAVDGARVRCSLAVPAGLIEGRPAGWSDETHPDAEGHDPDRDYAFRGETVGNAAFWRRPVEVMWIGADPAPAVGDLVVARRYDLEHAAGRTTARLTDPVRLGSFTDRASVGAFLPWGVHPTREAEGAARIIGSLSGVADQVDFLLQESEAIARSEPDEAICLFCQNPADREGDTTCVGLSSSGIAFFHCDSLSDEFHDAGLEPGVWIMRQAKPWAYQGHEGDWDAGIDGDWEPATQEDLDRHGLTHAEIEEAISEATEAEDLEPGAAVRYMELAEAACARQREESEADAAAPAP